MCLQIDDAMHISMFILVKHDYLVADYHQTQCCSLFPYREYIPSIKMGKTEGFPGIGGSALLQLALLFANSNVEHIEGQHSRHRPAPRQRGLREPDRPLNQPLFMARGGLNQQEQELRPGLMGL